MPDGTRTEAWNPGASVTVTRTVELAPGAPDGSGSGLFPAEYAGQMSALAVEGAKVASTTYEGRPALLVERAPARRSGYVRLRDSRLAPAAPPYGRRRRHDDRP